MAMDVEHSTDERRFPYWSSVRRRFHPDSPFFAPGNIERELLAKQVPLSPPPHPNQSVSQAVEDYYLNHIANSPTSLGIVF